MLPGMQAFKPLALPRVVVWAGLAIFTVYIGVGLLTGTGRDIAFRDLTWTPAALAEVIAAMIFVGGLHAAAAIATYRREVAAPDAGTIRFSGAPLGIFGELFFTIVAGLLLLVATYCAMGIPETILASHAPQYAHYESASPVPLVVFVIIFGGSGFLLITLRRYVWELRHGQPVRRYWTLAFSRGRVVDSPLRIYWTQYFVKIGYQRIPTAWWLRVEDPTSKGLFRDGSLARVPLRTNPYELANIEQAWRAKLVECGAKLAPSDAAVPYPSAVDTGTTPAPYAMAMPS